MSFLISDAMAEGAPAAQQGDPITSLLFFGGFILIFYFILIRPQQKRAKEHQKMVAALSVVHLQKQAIASVLPKGTLKTIGKNK